VYIVVELPRHISRLNIRYKITFRIQHHSITTTTTQHQSLQVLQLQLQRHHVFPNNPIRLHPQPRRPPNAPHPPRSRRNHFLHSATRQTHIDPRLLALPQRLERLGVGVIEPHHVTPCSFNQLHEGEKMNEGIHCIRNMRAPTPRDC
jgi:hypothetical protein